MAKTNKFQYSSGLSSELSNDAQWGSPTFALICLGCASESPNFNTTLITMINQFKSRTRSVDIGNGITRIHFQYKLETVVQLACKSTPRHRKVYIFRKELDQ